MDINDAFVALGLLLFALGLALTHPALVLAFVGYLAFTHGMSRSR